MRAEVRIGVRLRVWADTAEEIAKEMREHGDIVWDCHAGELDGAARIAREWAREIAKEIGQG
jgi:hypothetical protein